MKSSFVAQKWRPNGLQKNTRRPLVEVTPKKVFMIFVGENLLAKVTQKNFSGKVVKIRAKSLSTAQNLPKYAQLVIGRCELSSCSFTIRCQRALPI